MTWLWLGAASALALGCYDLAKKHALRENQVLGVLLLATCSGGLGLVAWLAVTDGLTVAWRAQSGNAFHLHLLGKAVLVTGSWVAAFAALKHLPISLVSPVRASAPVWTLLAAVLLLGERPGPWQWLGVVVMLAGFLAFALIGKREGIDVRRDRWVLCLLIATLLGAASALYDKVLLQHWAYDPTAVQLWFSVYLVLFQFLLWVAWGRRAGHLRWRWSIPVVGLLLVLADRLYFLALHQPDALIAVLSPLRRSSVVVAFGLGGKLFGERFLRQKTGALAVVLAGALVVLLCR